MGSHGCREKCSDSAVVEDVLKNQGGLAEKKSQEGRQQIELRQLGRFNHKQGWNDELKTPQSTGLVTEPGHTAGKQAHVQKSGAGAHKNTASHRKVHGESHDRNRDDGHQNGGQQQTTLKTVEILQALPEMAPC